MDYLKVLKRSFNITWRYRALWLFGILAALSSARRGSSGSGANYSTNSRDFGGAFPRGEVPPEVVGVLISIIIGIAVLAMLIGVLFIFVRYISRTALIRMVDEYETTGEENNVRWGFRAGWSRASWRLFLIDLVVGVPVAVVFILLFATAASPLLLLLTRRPAFSALGVVTSIGLFVLVIIPAIIVATAISFLAQFFWRTCILENTGVFESIRLGFQMARDHLKDVGIMAVIMLCIRLGVGLVLVPVGIVLLLLALSIAGIPALVTGLLTNLVLDGAVPWVLAAMVGLPILILIIGAPMLFLNGLIEVFTSSTWTLTYRELAAMDEVLPDEDLVALEPISP